MEVLAARGEVPDKLKWLAWNWASKKLGGAGALDEPTNVHKPSEVDCLFEERLPADIKNVGNLLAAVSKFNPPVLRSELLNALGLKDSTEVADLNAAWSMAMNISKEIVVGAPAKCRP